MAKPAKVLPGPADAPKPDQCSKDAILGSYTTEAQGFYNLTTGIATSFLGGSLFFMEKIASPAGASLWCLRVGWITLVASIVCIAIARRINLLSAGEALGRNTSGATGHYKFGNRFTTASLWFFAIGLLAITSAGMITKRKDGGDVANETSGVKSDTFESPKKGSINYGQTGSGNSGGSGSNQGGSGSSGSGGSGGGKSK